jgi:DNA mismatch repair protein MutS
MSFIADKQTLEDLNLLGRFKPHSVFNLFNKVKTAGGARLLENMFQQPLTDEDAINGRSKILRYFQERALVFPFNNEAFRGVENFLSIGTATTYPGVLGAVLVKKAKGSFLRDDQYGILHTGLLETIAALNTLKAFCEQIDEGPFATEVKAMQTILNDRRLQWLEGAVGVQELPVMKVAQYDFLLRHTLRAEMEKCLDHVYSIDVYIAVSDVARAKQFTYAQALPKAKNVANITGLRHPGLDKGVANDLLLGRECNMLFLTGANMAGKSTFMKAYGIAVYLAHMGFPVAVKEMVFSIRDGLFTSINVPDNLAQGYSHFYAEVLRVKTVAEKVSQGKDLVVIFDELFKGTNVKDAYDATLAVTAAFAAYRNCFYIISTHIIEVGDVLGQQCDNLQFSYLPTVMEGTVPRYTYTFKQGITSDRHGMMIIENEKILETLLS